MNAVRKLNRDSARVNAVRPIKVLQFGEGNFLRGFADWMIDVLNDRTDFNGDVQIVQPLSQGSGSQLNEQDGLYHVMLNGIRHGKPVTEVRLISCVRGVINPYKDYAKFLEAGENPDLEFVISNTTEAGITYDEKDKSPDNVPSSFPGKLTALLHHRFEHFRGDAKKGLVLFPCELIDQNGNKLKETVLRYAKAWGLPSGFSAWIEKNNQFCNTLVDRIVPGFPRETIHEVQSQLGFEDNMVVMAEPFHLWVIESRQDLTKKLPASAAGLDVKFVTDQSPYRTRKVRILNGAHTAMVPVAYLRGLRTVSEVVNDPQMRAFLQKLIAEEIIPVLNLPKSELQQFADDVLERFQNPFIKHELISIALNSVSKFKVRVLPTILEFKQLTGKLPKNLVSSLAGLILFYRGEFRGVSIPLSDSVDVIQIMKEAWLTGDPKQVVARVLANQSFWDQDLTLIEGLEMEVLQALVQLSAVNEQGIKSASLELPSTP